MFATQLDANLPARSFQTMLAPKSRKHTNHWSTISNTKKAHPQSAHR